MIIEMRTYFPRSMPAHREIGMRILGPFPDLDSREPMKEQFYEGAQWKSELEAKLMPMIEKYDVVVVEAEGGLGEWQ